ncbi:MAG: hypothetical protein J2O48_11555, partial [Solirubrobacterales bacterium]|nr:hypothetical protein [Solirubrobacterales bacterium]
LRANDQIQNGDLVVTNGFSEPNNPQVRSLYPPGIPVGRVSDFNYNTQVNSGQVKVSPFVNLRGLTNVQILTRVTS